MFFQQLFENDTEIILQELDSHLRNPLHTKFNRRQMSNPLNINSMKSINFVADRHQNIR